MFGAFALAQIPLGLGLDRWGPRWITSGLLFVGAVGSVIFAFAPSFELLMIGRALLGLGMAGALMGAMKIFSKWFHVNQFATLSGLTVGIGSSGALVAASPLAWFNEAFGWRWVFVGGAVITVFIGAAIIIWTRNTPPGVPWTGSTDTGGGVQEVVRDRRFWHIVPLDFFIVGTMFAFQSLWAGPYLYDVMRLDAEAVGNMLIVLSLGATFGALISGWLADRVGMMQVMIASGILFISCQVALIFHPPLWLLLLVYGAFGIAGSFNIILLAHTRRIFPANVTGRAISAVNLFGFGGVFVVQWLLGAIINRFPPDAAGHYPPKHIRRRSCLRPLVRCCACYGIFRWPVLPHW
ncbi:MAG: MFS transporter [Chloroflexaceae bacterium]|nr:MFS transporter [Chloroflexaceae bacterium]